MDPVTTLGVFGSSLLYELPRDRSNFVLGSAADCDVPVPTGFLSGRHCMFERRGSKLRVHDLNTKNGIVFNGRKETVFDLRPGDTFIAGNARFVAMNDEMRAAFPALVEILGSEDEPTLHSSEEASLRSPSEMLLAATNFKHLLITGEDGCDHARLARTIHQISLLRGRAAVEIADVPEERARQRDILSQAARSSLLIAIGPKTPIMDAAFASMIFSASYHIRVIAYAPTIARATEVFGPTYIPAMQVVALAPLADRRRMIVPLLDRLLSERGAKVRTSDITPDNLAAIQSYDWPGNLDQLREFAEWIVTLEREGSLRKAAKALGVASSTFQSWFAGIGVSAPLVAE